MISAAKKNTSEMAMWLGLLAKYYGIEPSYLDGTRQRHTVPVSTLQKLLSRLGIHVSDVWDVKKAVKEAKLSQWRKTVDEVLVVHSTKKPQAFGVCLPVGKHSLEHIQVEWVFENEGLTQRSFQCWGNRCKVVGKKNHRWHSPRSAIA